MAKSLVNYERGFVEHDAQQFEDPTPGGAYHGLKLSCIERTQFVSLSA
jgi:hypothetical protein